MFLPEQQSTKRKRRPLAPGQGKLLIASVLLMVGAFMPWLQTGLSSPKHPHFLWLFVLGFIALSGGLVPSRRIAYWHAVATAVIGLGLTAWYVWYLVTEIIARVGFSGWMIGPGLVLTAGAGGVAIAAARTLASVEMVPAKA